MISWTQCTGCQKETLHLRGVCSDCNNHRFTHGEFKEILIWLSKQKEYNENYIANYRKELTEKWEKEKGEITEELKEKSLQLTNTLQTGQEWSERQVQEIQTKEQQITTLENNLQTTTQAKENLQRQITLADNARNQIQTELTTEQKKTQALTLLANSRKTQLEQEKQALIKLANKKLTNQREAKQLLKELTEKWDKEKGEITEELTQTKTTFQNTLQSLQDLQTENRNLQQTKENQSQRILALEADKSELIKTLQKHQEKHNNYLTKEKSLLTKEIKLIKEALHE